MTQSTAQPAPGRLVVVSNRLPVTLRKTDAGTYEASRSTGGLATAMGPLLKQTGGIWVGWAGDARDPDAPDDPARREVIERWAREDGYHAVELSKGLVKGYYEGFSNETLWPLFHHFPFLLRFDPGHWDAYVEANERFRDAVLPHLRPGDLVWVHDYQLMLLPRLLRDARPDVRVGFFLHIPFPASEVFRLLPRDDEVLAGLLGADYLAFHTHADVQHFRTSVLRQLGLDGSIDEVDLGGRAVRLAALPIGIDPDVYARLLREDATAKQRLAELRDRYAGRRVLLGVDRLDYTKGIPERLRAFRRLLEECPEFVGRVVFMQVAVPSRERVETYRELTEETNELVGQINGQYGTPAWTPVVYMRRGLPPAELAALYAGADVALVTPLRDGMNLVAKEYVSCQRGGAGVLILSPFAGAATELGEALRCNPYDERRLAETIARALRMPEDERRRRMAALVERVERDNVFRWGERFLDGLRASAAARGGRRGEEANTADAGDAEVARAHDAYRRATNRLVLLDYDGTLVGYAQRPEGAVPPPGLVELLAALAGDPANTVAVVSGRGRRDLEAWFGGVPGLWLAAEHGAVVRSPKAGRWEVYSPADTADWKRKVRRVLDDFVARTPGSFVEEKEFSLVWHYRQADDEFAEWIANQVLLTLQQGLANTELRAVRGRKSIEVKLTWANKGEVLQRIGHSKPSHDFLLAAGDDRTDEDLFARLPPSAWTVHVGDQPTRARFRVPDAAAMRALLARLAGRGGGDNEDGG